MSVPLWAERYVREAVWEDGGREHPYYDCEGICRAVLREHGGNPPIPTYGVVSADGLLHVARAVRDRSALPPWIRVERAGVGMFDIVLMNARAKVGGRNTTLQLHIGVMVSGSEMLHIEEKLRAVVVRLDHPSIRERICGFLRHEALA